MPAYLLVDISVNDPARFREYVRLAPPIAEQGGAWLVSGAAGDAVEGDWRPERVSIASFPSAQHIRDYLGSDGYAAARRVREGATTTWMALAEGDEPPPGATGYVIADVEVTDPDGYHAYLPLVGPSMLAYGGKTFVRGEGVEVIEGERRPHRLVLIAFPTAERARAWWASDEYREAKAIRQRTARTDLMIVDGA